MPEAATLYTIRPLTVADKSALPDFLYHAIFVPAGRQPPPRRILEHPQLINFIDKWRPPHALGRGVEIGPPARLVGAAWLCLLKAADKSYGYIDDDTPELAVSLLPGYRGRGWGTALIRDLLAAAAGRYPAVSLSVDRANPALRLYRRLGFATVAEREDSVLMKKTFSGEQRPGS